MLGIIITGHGNFATGLGSDIELVAGKQAKLELIDFEKGMSSEQLNKKYLETIEKLDADQGIIFLTDLAGGTPFNQAAMIKANNENIGVIAGVNAPLILESLFNRETSVKEFIESAIQIGRNSIVPFEIKAKAKNIDSEGI